MSTIFQDERGQEFRMGFHPTPDDQRAKFAQAAFPTIPEAEWVEINRRKTFADLGWYPDQRQCNGCTGFSSAMTASKARVIAGQPAVKLSGAYVYSWINGGRDQGSNIGDALDTLEQHGACSEASCDIHSGYNVIYRKETKDHDAEAARFKVEKGIAIPNAEQAVAALQRGAIVEFAVCVGGNFGRLDSEGVQTRMDGGYSNHAVHFDGLVKTSRGWCVELQTWTKDFADGSRIKWPVEWLDKTKGQEMWAIFGMIDDPNDTHDPPTPV